MFQFDFNITFCVFMLIVKRFYEFFFFNVAIGLTIYSYLVETAKQLFLSGLSKWLGLVAF